MCSKSNDKHPHKKQKRTEKRGRENHVKIETRRDWRSAPQAKKHLGQSEGRRDTDSPLVPSTGSTVFR